jgi:hypothetical protein
MSRTLKTLLLTAAVSVVAAGAVSAQTADVQVIHNSPDPLASEVDVYINDDLALDDFAFREATPVLELPAGVELVIGIAPGTSGGPGDIIASFPVTLMDGARYVVMATGVLDDMLPDNPEGLDTSFTLEIFEPLTTMAPSDEVALLAYHGAPDAPTVDVVAVGVGVLVDNIAFGDFAGYITVPAADYTLQVTPGDDNGTVVAAFDAPLSGLGGGAAVVFASGFLSSRLAAFGLYAALPDGSVLELPAHTVASESASWSDVKANYR